MFIFSPLKSPAPAKEIVGSDNIGTLQNAPFYIALSFHNRDNK